MTKFMTDVGDTASEVLELISGRSCYAYSHERRQNHTIDWLRGLESTSVEVQDAARAGTPTGFEDIREPVIRRSSSGRTKWRGEKTYVAALGDCLPATSAHASRLAKGILDIIIIPPMEVSLTLSKGLRNPPLLFHDDRVRDSPTVVGVRSGLRAAGTVRTRPELESYPLFPLSAPTLLTCRIGIRIRHL